MEELEEFFKEVYPLKNLHIMDSNLESSSDKVAIILSYYNIILHVFWDFHIFLKFYEQF